MLAARQDEYYNDEMQILNNKEMRKISFTFCLIVLMSSVYAQPSQQFVQCFIGMTKAQVKDYWSTEVSEDCMAFQEETSFKIFSFHCENSSGGVDYDLTTVRLPVFEATFDSISKKCIYQKMEFQPPKYSIVNAQLKKAGFHYDETNKRWINEQKKVYWIVSDVQTFVSESGTKRIRTVECFLYKKK